MKKIRSYLITTSLLLGIAGSYYNNQAQVIAPPLKAYVETYFSPNGNCTYALKRAIDGAKNDVRVEAYMLTSRTLADAFIRAARRGIPVIILLDKRNRFSNGSQYQYLIDNGVAVQIDGAHTLMHNKITIIDGVEVWTGSFNYTVSAETKNAENLVCIRDGMAVDSYKTNWMTHYSHSTIEKSPKPFLP